MAGEMYPSLASLVCVDLLELLPNPLPDGLTPGQAHSPELLGGSALAAGRLPEVRVILPASRARRRAVSASLGHSGKLWGPAGTLGGVA